MENVDYSAVEGYLSVFPSGTGNVDPSNIDPMFVTGIDAATAPTTAGDFHLQGPPYTPDAILDMASDPLDPLTPNDDYDGAPRPMGAGWGMGAFEWQDPATAGMTNQQGTATALVTSDTTIAVSAPYNR